MGYGGLTYRSQVTVTLTVPLPAGLFAVIEVDESTVALVAEVSPNLTVAGETKPVPAIVTDVPRRRSRCLG